MNGQHSYYPLKDKLSRRQILLAVELLLIEGLAASGSSPHGMDHNILLFSQITN
jgi:hypothetical protein